MANPVLRLFPLTREEIVGERSYNYYSELKAKDPAISAQTTVNTGVTFDWGTFKKYMVVDDVALIVQEPFEDVSDAAYNSTLIDVGDANGTTSWIAAAQVNKNAGALIKQAFKTGAYAVPKTYAADALGDVIVSSMAAKKLSDLDKGSVLILVKAWKMAPPFDTDSVGT